MIDVATFSPSKNGQRVPRDYSGFLSLAYAYAMPKKACLEAEWKLYGAGGEPATLCLKKYAWRCGIFA